MYLKYLILLLSPFPVYADAYIDLSAEMHKEASDSFYQRNGQPIKNIIGGVEVGYEYNGYSVFVRHMSSVQQEDKGLNTIGIKVRLK